METKYLIAKIEKNCAKILQIIKENGKCNEYNNS